MGTSSDPEGDAIIAAEVLFDGRHDCYFDSTKVGLVWTRDELDKTWPTESMLHGWRMWNHFGGKIDIGVYPRRDDGLCRWGCIDIDSGDFSEALTCWDILTDAGVKAWIEKSGSWKDLSKAGYHVWVFASDWVEATSMRPMLCEVVRRAGLPDKTEVNPKQVKATDKGVGNCVRLPYGARSREHPGYSCMVFSPGGEFKDFTLEEFIDEVEETSVDLIEKLGASAQLRAGKLKAVQRALAELRQHEATHPLFGPQTSSGGGRQQRAWRILNGLDRATEGERNLCAFVIACHLHGRGDSLAEAESRMALAVERSFDGGNDFLDEALVVLRRIYGA